MKRWVGIVSLLVAFAVTIPVMVQSASPSKTDKLSKHPLLTLIVTAKTQNPWNGEMV